MYALREKLLDPGGADVPQAVVRIIDQPLAERAESQRDHHSVIQDLRRNVSLTNVILQVAHEQQIPRGMEAIMQSVVSDVAEHRAGTSAVIAMLVDRHAQLAQLLRVVRLNVSEECVASGEVV